MATHCSILANIQPSPLAVFKPDRGPWQVTVHGVAKSQTRLSDQAQHSTEGRGFASVIILHRTLLHSGYLHPLI